MDFNIIPDRDALVECAWCSGNISDTMEVFCVGTHLKPEVDLSEYQSHCIEIELAAGKRPVCMMVTAGDSQSKAEGNDGLFMVCSQECADQLKIALKDDISLGNLFAGVKDG